MPPRRSAAPRPLVKRVSASSASTSLSNPPMARSARQEPAGEEPGGEGDEHAGQRLLVDVPGEGRRRALALGGEPGVELLRLVAELDARPTVRYRSSLGGAASDFAH